MKNLRSIFYCVFATVVAAFVLSSCGKDDDKNKPDLDNVIEDGFYVVGAATSIADLKADGAKKAAMSQAQNEVTKTLREGMYEKYVALEGGQTFSLVLKEGTVETTYGAELADFVVDGTDYSVNLTAKKGTLTTNATLQVAESGLYHITVDLNEDGAVGAKTVVIAPVKAWAVNNGTGGTWAVSSFDKTTMTYTLTDQTVASAGNFKFQYGDGWKLPLSENVKAETSLGGTVDKLTPTGSDIAIGRGIFTIKLTWTLAESVEKSFSATLTKTQSLPAQDYSACEIELVGSAVAAGNPGAVADAYWNGWGNALSAGVPAKAGNIYTWTWSNVTLLAGGDNAFKVRTKNAAASGGIDKFDKGDGMLNGTTSNGDIKVPEEGAYNITVKVDADEDKFTMVITKL